jgi:hypothetical protein
MAGDAKWMTASGGAPSYTAGELRRAEAALLSPKGTAGSNRFAAIEGVRPGGGTIVSESGGTITVRAHAGVVSPDLSTTQGAYQYQLPADETHSLTAAHATLDRTDLISLQVSDDEADSSGARQVASVYTVGTAGAGVPSPPARSFELARVAVPHSGAGSPAVTERGLYTVASGGVLPVRDSSDRPAHYEGRAIYQADTDFLLVSDGSAWTLPKNVGGSVLDKAKLTADSSSTGGTEIDILTGSAVTLVAGRCYKLSFAYKGLYASSTSANNFVLRIKESSTTYMEWNEIVDATTARVGGSNFVVLDCTADISAGSHTFKVTLQRSIGSDTAAVAAGATYPATLLVEDAGPS